MLAESRGELGAVGRDEARFSFWGMTCEAPGDLAVEEPPRRLRGASGTGFEVRNHFRKPCSSRFRGLGLRSGPETGGGTTCSLRNLEPRGPRAGAKRPRVEDQGHEKADATGLPMYYTEMHCI